MDPAIPSLKGMTSRWSVKIGNGTTFGSTKAEVLQRCADRIAKAEAAGQSWTLNHEWHRARTSWPRVVIVSRSHGGIVESFEHNGFKLHWTDSCGSRSVYFYGRKHDTDYDNAKDIPPEVYLKLVDYVMNASGNQPPELLITREDPGLGIFIPEIDNKVLAAGGVPDGCIPAK